jgi:hypothetical protein
VGGVCTLNEQHDDQETEYIDTSELAELGYPLPETWYERRERIRKERKQAQAEAQRLFFELHGRQLSFMKIGLIFTRDKIENLTCSMCSDPAEFYQCLPSKCLFCAYHARSVKAYRRKQYRANRKFRDAKESRIMSKIHLDAERDKTLSE